MYEWSECERCCTVGEGEMPEEGEVSRVEMSRHSAAHTVDGGGINIDLWSA